MTGLKILGILEIIVGIVFLLLMASDIQLGFGIILLGLGIQNILEG
jgi:hypothetical protein